MVTRGYKEGMNPEREDKEAKGRIKRKRRKRKVHGWGWKGKREKHKGCRIGRRDKGTGIDYF